MRPTSTYKLLFLLYLLLKKSYSKNEIIKEFNLQGLQINRTTINNYIEKLQKSGIEVKVDNVKKENVYSIQNKNITLYLSQKELNSIEDAKKLLITRKDYSKIRVMMRLFYKISKFVKNKNMKNNLVDFGYYSKINWRLVRQLEKHCREKDVILIDYILPGGENRHIQFHTDFLKIGTYSQRLYVHGILENTEHYSHLPVDRIYTIKKIIKKKTPIEIPMETFCYTISREAYNEIGIDKNEEVVKMTDKFVTIERVADDNFYIIQRLLYFCPDLYYISNKRIKDLVVEKLEIMKDMYERKIDT